MTNLGSIKEMLLDTTTNAYERGSMGAEVMRLWGWSISFDSESRPRWKASRGDEYRTFYDDEALVAHIVAEIDR